MLSQGNEVVIAALLMETVLNGTMNLFFQYQTKGAISEDVLSNVRYIPPRQKPQQIPFCVGGIHLQHWSLLGSNKTGFEGGE